jgi:hypothetical protein
MIPKSFHRIFCFAACLLWTHHLLSQQLSSGGLTATPSAVFDFSNAGQSIPARKQASDPAACTVGEQYFNTTSNVLKVCTATNTWTAGLTQTTAQAGTPWKCVDAGSSGTAYACNMLPAPSAYVDNQLLIFTPNTSCAGGATTINVQSLGAKNIFKIDGATNPAANDCRAGQPVILVYDAGLSSGNGAFQIASLLGNAASGGGGGLGDPGSNGLVKRTALNTTAAAVAGTDYQAALIPGTGIAIAGSTISADTATMLTQATAQAGAPWKCTDAGASGATYSCVMVPAPSAYFDRQLVIFTPNASCSGGATTLNIQSLGAKNIYKIDGATNPAANDCRAGQPMLLLYNASLSSGAGAFQMASLLGNASFSPLPVGSAIAAASTITPTSAIHHITGTVQINTITAPSQFAASGMGGCLRLIPDAAFTTGTSGNIAISSNAVVSRALELCYDNGTSKWYPSY